MTAKRDYHGNRLYTQQEMENLVILFILIVVIAFTLGLIIGWLVI